MSVDKSLYATCASGLQELLATELRGLGALDVSTAGAGVRFGGGLEAAYKACLWSRVANRVLMPVYSGAADSPEALYDLVKEVDWSEHMSLQSTLAVDFFTSHSTITHSQYGALKVKDAIVDQFRERSGERPNVERETPDLRVNVYLFRNKARIAVDLSGSSLHRRGYREQAGPAPVKENLAASLLLACDWPARARRGEAFSDPLCGSGTLVIEAAMIACNMAPGLKRAHFGFKGWLGHDDKLWQQILSAANDAKVDAPCALSGADKDARAIGLANDNAELAGVADAIQFQHGNLLSQHTSVSASAGLVLTNPPYGERLDTDPQFYANLGSALSRQYAGWHCGVFTALTAPVKHLRLPMKPLLKANNGGIECALYEGGIPAVSAFAANLKTAADDEHASAEPASAGQVWADAKANRQNRGANDLKISDQAEDKPASGVAALSVDAEPFVNRLRKNSKKIKSWLKREGVFAWRVYDADLPEFAVAIDIYDCESQSGIDRHVVVQEYQAPATVNTAMAEARLAAALAVIPDVFSVSIESIHLKVREKQSGLAQYEKQSASKVTGLIKEHGYLLECNFTDYLDTGVFLDHRKIRQYIQQNAADKRFLNLFSYTGSATIAAAAGGANGSVSVDLSNRYSQWLTRNLRHNGINESEHAVIRSDVNDWLDKYHGDRFDLILLDPPTFSNSTGVDADWNVQRDHVACIHKCMTLLEPGGILVFSNNYRRFKLDAGLGKVLEEKKSPKSANNKKPTEDAPTKVLAGKDLPRYHIQERSYWSLDTDFQRNTRIHQCWFISHQ